MGKIVLRAFMVLSLLFVFSAAAYADKSDRIFLWSVAGPKGSVFLLGSVHVPGADAYPLDERIGKAYQKSRRVVFEADPEEMSNKAVQKSVFSSGMYRDKKTLKDHISKETYELLLERLKLADIPIARFEKYKPWLCAVSLSSVELKRLGYDPKSGIEVRFCADARKDEKEVVFLETSSNQITLLSQTLSGRQEDLLKQAMKELDVIGKRSSEIVQAWRNGDAEKMDAITGISLDEYPEIRNVLFAKRNAQWVSKIEKLMKNEGNTLVIMGAGHLVGKDGVLSLLQEKGYSPVQQ